MIDLNRNTLPLYKRLDDKNKMIAKINKKDFMFLTN
tara:strand:- start:3357 stop:3464 length:108 start_codon:yes stop_codon:yes gene_type:complete